MIPKVIHYCWFGKGEKSALIQTCIESWKLHCPDYKIVEWNEENFDVSLNRFAKEALESKKYAFVSDYARLRILWDHGGIYVDTDLEITKSLDRFLEDRAFSSFETPSVIPTAIMGSEPRHPWIGYLLDYYTDKNFLLKNGETDQMPNTNVITEMTMKKYGLRLDNSEQILDEGIHLYPNYVLCTKVFVQKNHAIHHFLGSWLETNDKEFYRNEYMKFKKNYTILSSILRYERELKQPAVDLSLYRNIYLFGEGEIAHQLINYFNKININIQGMIVRRKEKGKHELDYMEIEDCKKLSAEDIIIVTPSYAFNSISKELEETTSAQIISVEMLLDIWIVYG